MLEPDMVGLGNKVRSRRLKSLPYCLGSSRWSSHEQRTSLHFISLCYLSIENIGGDFYHQTFQL